VVTGYIDAEGYFTAYAQEATTRIGMTMVLEFGFTVYVRDEAL
jgi:hypothetical protein